MIFISTWWEVAVSYFQFLLTIHRQIFTLGNEIKDFIQYKCTTVYSDLPREDSS